MRMLRLTTLAVAVTTALAGCSLAPTYHPPQTAVPAQYKEIGDWQPAKPADTASRGDWWREYHDSTLDQLVAGLDQANPTLAEALSHYDESQALEQQAQSYLLPTLNLGGYDTQNTNFYNKPHIFESESQQPFGHQKPNNYNEQFGGLELSYELDLWGRVRNMVAEGKAQSEAAAADLESVRLSLRASLTNNYISLRGLDAQVQLLKDVVVAYQKALTLTEDRYKGGIDSAMDVSRARAQLDSAQAELSDLSASRALYEHAIATLVGKPASSFSLAPGELSLALPVQPLGVPSQLLQRRPDIASAERQMAAANAGIGVARAAYYPTIMLGGFTGAYAVNSQQLAMAPMGIWSIGPSALLNVFDAGRRRAINRQAKDQMDIAAAQYRATVLGAFQQVEDNLALLNHLARESKHVNEAVKDTNKTLSIAMNRYREGMVNYLEVVTAQTSALRAQLLGINIRVRRLQADVNLVKALGGGYQAPEHGEKMTKPAPAPAPDTAHFDNAMS